MSSLGDFLAARGVTVHRQCGSYNLSNRAAGKGGVRHIIEHYTGGTGSAYNNCVYFGGGNRDASADWFVDKDGAIWQYNPDPDRYYSWAVGDGRGKYGITNVASVSIEYVNTGDAFTAAQIEAGGALTRALMAYYGLGADRVVRHYDASRKRCPAYYVDQARWSALHARLTGGTAPAAPTTPSAPAPSKIAVDGYWGMDTTAALQRMLGTVADGEVWGQYSGNRQYLPNCTSGWKWSAHPSGSAVVRALQARIGATVDGIVGQATVKALQRLLGVGQDGICGPKTVRSLQAALNAGKF